MARYAVIDRTTKEVVNVIVWDGESDIGFITEKYDIIRAEGKGDIGEIYDSAGNKFKRPITVYDRHGNKIKTALIDVHDRQEILKLLNELKELGLAERVVNPENKEVEAIAVKFKEFGELKN